MRDTPREDRSAVESGTSTARNLINVHREKPKCVNDIQPAMFNCGHSSEIVQRPRPHGPVPRTMARIFVIIIAACPSSAVIPKPKTFARKRAAAGVSRISPESSAFTTCNYLMWFVLINYIDQHSWLLFTLGNFFDVAETLCMHTFTKRIF